MSTQGPFLQTESHIVSILRTAVSLRRITEKEAKSILYRIYWNKRTSKKSGGINQMFDLARKIGGLRGVYLWNLTKLQKLGYLTTAMWAPIRPRLIDNTFVRGHRQKRKKAVKAAVPKKRKRGAEEAAVVPAKRKREVGCTLPSPHVCGIDCVLLAPTGKSPDRPDNIIP